LGIYRVTCQLLLQALSPARIRGRVLATFELTFWGIFSLGTFIAGLLADAYGAPAVALGFGAATLVGVALIAVAYRPFLALDVDVEGRGVIGRMRHIAAPAVTIAVPATAPADASTE